MRQWITEEDGTPQRFPLQRLLRQVFASAGVEARTCDLRRARGYGADIRALERALDSVESMSVEFSALDKLAEGTEQWFYDLEAQVPGTDIRFGLHDSTALFVDGDPSLVTAVAGAFTSSHPAIGGSAN